MDTKQIVTDILREIKPTKDLTDVTDIVEGGYLDSFEIMALITNLTERFGIEIDIDEIIPENFNSVDAVVSMVERLK